MSASKACGVKVIARFRPFSDQENAEITAKQMKPSPFVVDTKSNQVSVNVKMQTVDTYSFDYVFDETSRQSDIYDAAAKSVVHDIIDGYNGTIFAYGQTGSGKTYTMSGDLESEEYMGVIPRVVRSLFDIVGERLEDDTRIESFTLKCSYLEIYNERINDLLDVTKSNLAVRESPEKGVFVDKLTAEYVTSGEEIIELLHRGNENRATAATGANERSSRSHSLFTVEAEQTLTGDVVLRGVLNLTDLAGSEKVRKTQSTGQQLEEAKKINQSLTALGKCIFALSDTKKNTHIPYRDSKLTRVLSDSLGGNVKTTLIINCSPSTTNLDETVSTLKFGQRAKLIESKVGLNRFGGRNKQELRFLITRLKQELTNKNLTMNDVFDMTPWRQDGKLDEPEPTSTTTQAIEEERARLTASFNARVQSTEAEKMRLQEENQKLSEENTRLTRQIADLEAEFGNFTRQLADTASGEGPDTGKSGKKSFFGKEKKSTSSGGKVVDSVLMDTMRKQSTVIEEQAQKITDLSRQLDAMQSELTRLQQSGYPTPAPDGTNLPDTGILSSTAFPAGHTPPGGNELVESGFLVLEEGILDDHGATIPQRTTVFCEVFADLAIHCGTEPRQTERLGYIMSCGCAKDRSWMEVTLHDRRVYRFLAGDTSLDVWVDSLTQALERAPKDFSEFDAEDADDGPCYCVTSIPCLSDQPMQPPRGLQPSMTFVIDLTMPGDRVESVQPYEPESLTVIQLFRFVSRQLGLKNTSEFSLVEYGTRHDSFWYNRKLRNNENLFELIHRWHEADLGEGVALSLKFQKWLFYPDDEETRSNTELELEYRQACADVLSGYLHVATETYLLAALQLQASITQGVTEVSPTACTLKAQQLLKEGLKNYVPVEYFKSKNTTMFAPRKWTRDILSIHDDVNTLSRLDAMSRYVSVVRQWPLYGTVFFPVEALASNYGVPTRLILGVNQEGVVLLKRKEKRSPRNKDICLSYTIEEIQRCGSTDTKLQILTSTSSKGKQSKYFGPLLFATKQGDEICEAIVAYAKKLVSLFESEVQSTAE
eukprot:Rmarinus@m.7737